MCPAIRLDYRPASPHWLRSDRVSVAVVILSRHHLPDTFSDFRHTLEPSNDGNANTHAVAFVVSEWIDRLFAAAARCTVEGISKVERIT